MAADSRPLDIAYAKLMKNYSLGTALYTPLPYRFFRPGSVGYFHGIGSWNPIADLSAPDSVTAAGYSPVDEQLERAPADRNVLWGPKVSSKTKTASVKLEGKLSEAAAAAVPVDVGAWYRFTTAEDGGALLLTKPPVRHERYY